MTKAFVDRIMRERIVDTATYRYIVTEKHDQNKQWAEIKRLPLDKLDTAAAIDGWEVVKRIY